METTKKKRRAERRGKKSPIDVASEEDIKLAKEFDLFCSWRSIPRRVRLAKHKDGRYLSPEEVADSYGVDSQIFEELLELKTFGQFAEKFGVHKDTLTRWNKIILRRDLIGETRRWALDLTKEVIWSLYENAMDSGGATFKDRENFLKVVNNWNEKLAVEHNVGESLLDILKKGLSKNANIKRK